MAFKMPTLADLKGLTGEATTTVTCKVKNQATGKVETYTVALAGDCDDTPLGIARLGAAQTKKVIKAARKEKTENAGGAQQVAKSRPFESSADLERFLMQYVEGTVVNADGIPIGDRENKADGTRGGVDPALTANGEAPPVPAGAKKGK